MALAQEHFTRGLDQHVSIIKRQVDRSITDGEARNLAVALVSGNYDYARDPRTGEDVPVVRAYGKNFLAPPGPACAPRDEMCEITKIWDFLVLNCRYVYDPAEIDLFATLRETLRAGGGDCDDASIAFAALLGSIGFRVIARVISTQDDPDTWVHVYPMVGITKDNPRQWMALDITVAGATPGWQFEHIANYRDFQLV